MVKFLALTLYLLARITLTLISYFAIISCFQRGNFKGFNLEISYISIFALHTYNDARGWGGVVISNDVLKLRKVTECQSS